MSNIQKAAETLLAASMRLDAYGYKSEADRLDVIAEHLARRLVLAAREQEIEARLNTPRQRKIVESHEQVLARLYQEKMVKEAERRTALQPYDTCLHCAEYLFTGDQAYQVHDNTVLHLHCVPKYLEQRATYNQRLALNASAKDDSAGWSNLSEEQVQFLLPGRITVLD